jgi:hypothetical protein
MATRRPRLSVARPPLPAPDRDGFASRSTAEQFARELPDEFLQCRELAHVWVSWSATWSEHTHEYRRVLRCSRCLTEREQRIDASGSLVGGGYHYAEGYSTPGLGRIAGEARDALRLASLTRSMSGESVRGERRGPVRRGRTAS